MAILQIEIADETLGIILAAAKKNGKPLDAYLIACATAGSRAGKPRSAPSQIAAVNDALEKRGKSDDYAADFLRTFLELEVASRGNSYRLADMKRLVPESSGMTNAAGRAFTRLMPFTHNNKTITKCGNVQYMAYLIS